MNANLYYMGYLLNNTERGITYGGKLRVPYGLSEFPPYFRESSGLYIAHDSSWGTKPRPHGGHVVMRTNGAIIWSAKAFKIVVPDSSAHAETAEGSRASKAGVYMRTVLTGVKRPVQGPTLMLGDNKAMYDMVSKEGTTSKSRHFERATIFIKYMVMRLIVACKLVSTKFMIADVFTKATDRDTFLRMRDVLRNTGELTGAESLAHKIAEVVKGMFY